MSYKAWYYVPVNPIPWTTPPYSVGRSGKKLFVVAGKNHASEAFKEAVQDSLRRQDAVMAPGKFHRLSLYFWRQREQYKDSADRTRTKNAADATNMQKLAEDALQGILFKNDRENVSVRSEIVEQSITAEPGILILIESFDSPPPMWEPEGWDVIFDHLDRVRAIAAERSKMSIPSNVWPPVP